MVDLRAITEISPFVDGLEYLDHAINKQYLEKLNSEMSKSLRRSDSTLDYVPTQYIVDFIKSIEHNGTQEYDGIEYNSTTNPGGYNLAIFNPDLFECVSVSVYDIEKLQYTSKKVLWKQGNHSEKEWFPCFFPIPSDRCRKCNFEWITFLRAPA